MKKGQRYEYKARDQLRQDGYTVIRSSDSAFPDLIAWNAEKIRFIEVKYAGSPPTLSAAKYRFREAAKLVTFPANAKIELWIYSPKGLTVIEGGKV